MKQKKFIGALLGAFMVAGLAGCYEPLEITNEEMDMVAEYAAGVLVKHGTQSTEVLLDKEEQKVARQLSATPTPRPTLAPVGTSKEETQAGDEEAVLPTVRPTPTAMPENTELTMQDFTDLMGKGEFFFRYTDYECTSIYQGEGDLFAAAEEGKQLIVLEFEITNQSSQAATLVLNKGAEKEFAYTLRIGSKTIKPSLTLLQEDFYTSYERKYAAGETKKGVLVFECAKETSLENMKLAILKDADGKEDSVLIKVK